MVLPSFLAVFAIDDLGSKGFGEVFFGISGLAGFLSVAAIFLAGAFLLTVLGEGFVSEFVFFPAVLDAITLVDLGLDFFDANFVLANLG